MRILFRLLLASSLLFMITGCINNSDDTTDSDAYNHTQNPGLSAADLLNDEQYKVLVVEIDYMGRNKPSERALDSLHAFLEKNLNKTTINILEPTEIQTGNRDSYSAEQIRGFEEKHRDHFTNFDVLSVYMLIVDGRYEQNNVLGIAYYNTSTAYFGVAFDDATAGFGAPSRYLTEAISFRHEFGHLLGLVGIPGSGTDVQEDHKDEEHGNHCSDNTCLMYYAMERPDLLETFLGEEQIPALDEFCLQDLKANGGS